MSRAEPPPPSPPSDGVGYQPYGRQTVPLADAGTAVPAWTLRLLIAALCCLVVGVMALDDTPQVFLAVLATASLAAVLSPGSAASAGLTCGVVIGLVIVDSGGDDQLRPTVLALVFLIHLIHVVSGIAGLVPLRSALHLPALRGPLARFAVIQVAAFALVGLAAVLPGGKNSVPLEVAAVLGVTGVTVLAVVLLRRR